MSKIYHVSDTECINLDYCVQVSISATNFEVVISLPDGYYKRIPVRSFEEGKTIYNDIVNMLENKENL